MSKTTIMQSITRVLRIYLCMTQIDFSKFVGLSQPDLCELENQTEPFGKMDKYLRLSKVLGIPVDALLYNDFRKIPSSFFQRFPAPVYTKSWSTPIHEQGYAGEELILQREQVRLSKLYPALANLVLPVSCMDIPSPGYDILSFDDHGIPFAIEVKTSISDSKTFFLTPNEYASAKLLTSVGQGYIIALISGFGTDSQTIVDIPFPELLTDYKIQATSYQCAPIPAPHPITGLLYYRLKQGLQQSELAAQMGIPAPSLCRAETTGQMSAPFYLAASKSLGVSVDDLLKTYDLEFGGTV